MKKKLLRDNIKVIVKGKREIESDIYLKKSIHFLAASLTHHCFLKKSLHSRNSNFLCIPVIKKV